MRVNVEKVMQRDEKISDLNERADDAHHRCHCGYHHTHHNHLGGQQQQRRRRWRRQPHIGAWSIENPTRKRSVEADKNLNSDKLSSLTESQSIQAALR
ncbi:hypothetical protein BOX15_Mlig025643g1 [Macrostomum lignano]|uniref:V-SNARE coiled-coil homology domain-containing protein n=1 Tax=Macrostomum lignano TaxID=282301 RepID=A0A267EYT8_9PLAT|nr:hypothetical protein BOX15_Mlig025643g1 [Macrostomum lignano]